MTKRAKKPSMRRKLFLSLGSIAAALLLTCVISILEYQRMSNFVSELIASNINSLNQSRKLASMVENYHLGMLAVVVENDISRMPDFNNGAFSAQCDTLIASFTASSKARQLVGPVLQSFSDYVSTSQQFDQIFLSADVDPGKWFFETLQPSYNQVRDNLDSLSRAIHNELRDNSENFDAGFYRGVMPGFVCVGVGLLLVFLLTYFIIVFYVNPLMKMASGIDNYRSAGKRYNVSFDGDDQIADINTGITELVEENLELKRRVKDLREDRQKLFKDLQQE